jgi:drug/metabolite transporter (DMT)-like permease
LALKSAAPSVRQWLVVLVGGAGLTLAVYAPGEAGEHPRLGGLLILAASFFGSLGLVAYQHVGKTMGSRAGTGFSLFLGGVVLAALGAGAWSGAMTLFDGYIVGLTLWLAFVSAAAFSLWNWLSRLFPVHELATYRFMIPLCGMVESLVLLDGERLTPAMGAGTALVIAAMVWAGHAGRAVRS